MESRRRHEVGFLLLCVAIEYGLLGAIVLDAARVKADSFFPVANIEENRAYFAIGLAREGQSLEENGVMMIRPLADITDENTSLLMGLRFSDLVTQVDGVYRRVSGVTDSVSALPGDKVSLWWYPYNNAGHAAGVKNTWLFLGPYESPTIVDIVDIVDSSYRNIAYFAYGNLKTKGGMSISLGALGNVQQAELGGYALQPKKLFTAEVKNAVTVSEINHRCVNEAATMTFRLYNPGSQQERVELPGGTGFTLNPSEARVVQDIPISPQAQETVVAVKNEVKRCLGRSVELASDDPDSHVFLAARDDANQWYWSGISVEVPPSTSGDIYCITRVPYEVVIKHESCAPLPTASVVPVPTEIPKPTLPAAQLTAAPTPEISPTIEITNTSVPPISALSPPFESDMVITISVTARVESSPPIIIAPTVVGDSKEVPRTTLILEATKSRMTTGLKSIPLVESISGLPTDGIVDSVASKAVVYRADGRVEKQAQVLGAKIDSPEMDWAQPARKIAIYCCSILIMALIVYFGVLPRKKKRK